MKLIKLGFNLCHAMAVLVIRSECGGPEAFITKDNGILIDINDKEKLIQSMKYMHSNIDRYDKESIAKDIEERFCFKSVANKIIEVYKNVINKSIY